MNNGYPPPIGPYDPSGSFFNPGNTAPAPMPRDIGVAFWSGSRMPLTWTPGTSPVIWTASWSSPIFDFHPWLRGVQDKSAGNGQTGAQPIWRAGLGAGGQLFVQVFGLTGNIWATSGLRVLAWAEAHITNPIDIVTVETPEDITNAWFTPGKQSALMNFTPTGGGYPVRIWRMNLRFDVLINNGGIATVPPFEIQGAYY